jgi:predicted amidophosphoribosyltransferase
VSNSLSTAVLPIAVIVLVIGILAILMIQKRKNTPKVKPDVKRNGNFCRHCGKELQGNGDFCPHCGTKQT